MRRIWKAVVVLCSLGMLCQCHSNQEIADYKNRLDVLSEYVSEGIVKLEDNLSGEKQDPTSRDLSHLALAYVMLKNEPVKAEQVLKILFEMQDMNPASESMGNFPWQRNHPEMRDPNAVEFTSLALGAFFLKYSKSLSPEMREQSSPHLAAALKAIQRHPVRVGYTNIYLMKVANQILLGEYLGDSSAVNEGVSQFKAWCDFTRVNGITEYDTGTYSPIQLNALYVILNHAANQEAKKLARNAIDYLWTDFLANYFQPREVLSGSGSRNYSFTTCDGNILQLYYLYGYRNAKPKRLAIFSDQVLMWATGVWNGSKVPSTPAFAKATERIIRQRFGSDPGADRYNYITPDFAMGTSSRFYEVQDRFFSLEFASPKDLTVMSVIPDPFDSPYGKVKYTSKSGHSKPNHLKYAISSVQEKGSALILLDLSPGSKIGSRKSLATNVLIPVDVDGLFINGNQVSWSESGVPVPMDATVGIMEGKTGVAIRMFLVDGLHKGCPEMYLKSDGGKSGRLVAYHGREGDLPYTNDPVRAGILILARHCESKQAFEKFIQSASHWNLTEKMEGALWMASTQSPADEEEQISLSASLNLETKDTGERSVNGVPYKTSEALSVNGIANLFPP